MPEKLMILLVNADPGRAESCLPALGQALSAATMEYEAEVVFCGRCALLAEAGRAAAVPVPGREGRSLHDVIREARDAGTRFKVCPLQPLGADTRLIEEIDDTVGSAYLVTETMDAGTVTLAF